MKDIDQFICQEVRNQGFDLNTAEGKQRVGWMREAWKHAEDTASAGEEPTIKYAEELGSLVERIKNCRGFRVAVNVRVGSRIAPHCGDVRPLMELLGRWSPATDDDCLEWYHCFEIIHPFEDGNGRVGKILYNWWLDRLDDPEMPPDLFGGGVP